MPRNLTRVTAEHRTTLAEEEIKSLLIGLQSHELALAQLEKIPEAKRSDPWNDEKARLADEIKADQAKIEALESHAKKLRGNKAQKPAEKKARDEAVVTAQISALESDLQNWELAAARHEQNIVVAKALKEEATEDTQALEIIDRAIDVGEERLRELKTKLED